MPVLWAFFRSFVVIMAKIKNIIFDFDGTLADTAPFIVATMQATIAELRLPGKTDDECRATIGLRLEDVPAVLWPGVSCTGPVFASAYRRIFDRLKRPMGVKCYPGVIDTLKDLHVRGYGMAIASSRSHASLEEYAATFGLTDIFAMLVGGNDVANGKPAPDPVLAILERTDWKPEETLVVGDAPVDILMARAAGTASCGVTYGNSSPETLADAGATYLIDTFPEIMKIL